MHFVITKTGFVAEAHPAPLAQLLDRPGNRFGSVLDQAAGIGIILYGLSSSMVPLRSDVVASSVIHAVADGQINS